MTPQQLSEHRETAINELITHWVCMGGKGAVPNAEGAHFSILWIVKVYETLIESKGVKP